MPYLVMASSNETDTDLFLVDVYRIVLSLGAKLCKEVMMYVLYRTYTELFDNQGKDRRITSCVTNGTRLSRNGYSAEDTERHILLCK